MKANPSFQIDGKFLGGTGAVYFIADIAANHDGDLERAKNLIFLAADAGADAAKFQHFKAESIVSDFGFRALGKKQTHQSSWKKTVFEVYKDASVSLEWTAILQETCKEAGISFFSSPYSIELVDHIDPYVPAYKIGSGDITWLEMIEYIAAKGKPYILASGASSLDDVQRAVSIGLSLNANLCLMQCNTNYTASLENFNYIQLKVLSEYRKIFPDLVLGLSDHTPGHSTVLGAVALGAKVIEKHFTDSNDREGPDHRFALNHIAWREMVDRTRELENALGTGIKRVEKNEAETVILQRRAIRLATSLDKGTTIERKNLEVLRPCPENALPPYEIDNVIGRVLRHSMQKGEHIQWKDLELP